MSEDRQLVVIADDFGIGPETSHGILELGCAGRVGGTVLLVNSPHAAEAVSRWRAEGRPLELGWHPNLTLDRPVASARRVPSLVGESGNFFTLGGFLTRLLLGRIRRVDLETELRAQWHRFIELVGHPPTLVASHQHIALFPPVDRLLFQVLQGSAPRIYVRNVVEPWSLWRRLGGSRFKRLVLNLLGRRGMSLARQRGFVGAEHLLGLIDGNSARHPDFFLRWLQASSGHCVELMCHPGRADETLRGRDSWREQRPQELDLLQAERFAAVCAEGGWSFTAPSQVLRLQESGRLAA